jgi:hypothetical protein
MWLIKSSMLDWQLLGFAQTVETKHKSNIDLRDLGNLGGLLLASHFVHEVDDEGIRGHGENFTLCINTKGYIG